MDRVEQYISSFPANTQDILRKIRRVILENANGAEERFSYGLAGYYVCGKLLVYFGAFAKHIGFYATPNAHEKFTTELSAYKQGKGSVQFPLSAEIPYILIKRIVKFRLAQIKQND